MTTHADHPLHALWRTDKETTAQRLRRKLMWPNAPRTNVTEHLEFKERVEKVISISIVGMESTSFKHFIREPETRQVDRMRSEIRELRARIAAQEDMTAELVRAVLELRDEPLRGKVAYDVKSMISAAPAAREVTNFLVRGALALPDPPAVDLRRLAELYVIPEEGAGPLQRRLDEREQLHHKLVTAAAEIAKVFPDGKPTLGVEQSGRIIVAIPTRMDATAAGEVMERFREDWWRPNIKVDDRITMSLSFK